MMRLLGVCSVAALCLAVTACAPADDKKDEKVVKTDSGLQYVDLKEGTGNAAKVGDTVEVYYTGWLKDGTKFDSNVGKDTFPVTIGKTRVIKGWTEGLQGMKAGSKRKLIIPAELAYGKKGFPPDIPADAELTFEVEMVKIK
jgi:FKBP-type peptidyl-prolyl cis-trans isomerase